MGWKVMVPVLNTNTNAGRNPLSLDMGWKDGKVEPNINLFGVAIRFRWIWVGKLERGEKLGFPKGVAIRFRWIWVGKNEGTAISGQSFKVAIRFRWIWVGKFWFVGCVYCGGCRNPLSLDMGWKASSGVVRVKPGCLSQSAFAGYGLER